MWAISTKMDPARDITVVEGTPIDYLDFASSEDGLGSKIGLDATDKWPPETKRAWGREIRMDEAVIERIDRLWPRSEEHTSELQSLMRISYAVFCLKKKNNKHTNNSPTFRKRK